MYLTCITPHSFTFNAPFFLKHLSNYFKKTAAILVVLFFTSSSLLLKAQTPSLAYNEVNGMVIIQAESIMPVGDWVIENIDAGFTGAGYIRWNGPDYFGSPGNGTLAYRVKINSPGEYNVRFRMSHLGAPAGDLWNDVWAKMNDGTWVKVLHPANRKDEGFTFHSPTEPSGGVFDQMRYTLSAGIHTLYISGRSTNARLDRIHFYKDGTPNPLNLALAESEQVTEDDTAETPVINVNVSGELKKWHPVSITLDGPETSETNETNPFLDYRFEVTFTQGEHRFTVPGYFAADGDAAETSASTGNKWRAHFTPNQTGVWTYEISMRAGSSVAISSDSEAGEPTEHHGFSGTFEITETDKSGSDHRSKGMLRYIGGHYLQFDNGEYFLKGGANSPENFLAYQDFDSTYSAGEMDYTKQYEAHIADWQSGDPTWKNGKGKGIIGAVNYLSGKGMNTVYFLTMNVNGDGNDVWPWLSHSTTTRYDVSKLAQWEMVFNHMDKQGLMLHVVLQETENERLLDGGALGEERKLYLREMVARFGHHHALTWNLGEENDENTDTQRKAFADYIRTLDIYDHPIVIHTFPGQDDDVYEPLLGFENFDGPSLQLHNMDSTYKKTLFWRNRSAEAGRPWIVSVDEFGPFQTGVTANGPGNNFDDVRRKALWPHLMAGGAGVEWYFGYETGSHDLNNEDWRTRDEMWDYTRHALTFFQTHLPFHQMHPSKNLTNQTDAYVFADSSQTLAIYTSNADSLTVFLTGNEYNVRWYNPRTGGELQQGDKLTVRGPGGQFVGHPPSDSALDWVLLLENTGAIVTYPEIRVSTNLIDFGTVEADSGYSLPLTIQNVGTEPLFINEVSIAGEDASLFTLNAASVTDGDALLIDIGQSELIEIILTPDSLAVDSLYASLAIVSNDPENHTMSVALQGFVKTHTDEPNATSITKFVLIDADTDKEIGELSDGSSYDLTTLPPHLNVRAEVFQLEGDQINHVLLSLSPTETIRKESIAPYALFGDLNGNFLPGTFTNGSNTLTAKPTINGIAGEVLSITFNIVGTNAATKTGDLSGYSEEEPGVKDAAVVSDEDFVLEANYPDPFNTRTTIPYFVAQAGHIRLAVYDMIGREVNVLVDHYVTEGRHEVVFDASTIPSGAYFYRMDTNTKRLTRQLLVVR